MVVYFVAISLLDRLVQCRSFVHVTPLPSQTAKFSQISLWLPERFIRLLWKPLFGVWNTTGRNGLVVLGGHTRCITGPPADCSGNFQGKHLAN